MVLLKPLIKNGQIWKQKGNNMTIVISNKSGGKWKAKVLSEKRGVFKGSHTLASWTLWKRFELQ